VIKVWKSSLTKEEQDYFELIEGRAKIAQLEKENTTLKAVLAEVEKQTVQVREMLRVAANNMAVLHHE
jgi:hypothetical protein